MELTNILLLFIITIIIAFFVII